MTLRRFYFCTLSLSILFGLIGSCKENNAKKASLSRIAITNSTENTPALPQSQKVHKSMFVIAPNGLSLRKENAINSERLLLMPLGREVRVLEEVTDDSLTIENIRGAMLKIEYQGNKGFSFSGYLSPFPLPNKGQSIAGYADKLKKLFPDVSFSSKPTDPDFHEGTIDTFRLPARSWSEAFFMAFAIYQLPKSFGFPDSKGVAQETIEEPTKPTEAWSSFMTITRTENNFKSIEYAYRAEGFGYRMLLTRPNENSFEIEYLSFID